MNYRTRKKQLLSVTTLIKHDNTKMSINYTNQIAGSKTEIHEQDIGTLKAQG